MDPADRFAVQRLGTGDDAERLGDYVDVAVSDDATAVVFDVQTADDPETAEWESDVLPDAVHVFSPASGEVTPLLATHAATTDGALVFGGREPAISASGRYVAITAYLHEPSGDDPHTGTSYDAVVVVDRQTGDITRVSPRPDEAGYHNVVKGPAVSDDGAVVVYTAGTSADLTALPTSWERFVAVGGAVRSLGTAGAQPYPSAPALSGDGTRAAWYAWDDTAGWRVANVDLSTLVGADDPSTTPAPTPVPGPVAAAPGDDTSDHRFPGPDSAFGSPALSADGDLVAYAAYSDGEGGSMKLLDLASADATPVTPATFATGDSTYPAGSNPYGTVVDVDLSGDGLFATFSTFLGGAAQVWRHGVQSGLTSLVTHLPDGTPAADGDSRGSVASTGLVAMSSTATGLASDDANTVADLFLAAPTLPSGPTAWPDGGTLVADQLTDTSVSLSWDPAKGETVATGYRVYRDGTRIGRTSTTAFPVEGLAPGTRYRFTVRAEYDDGSVSPDAVAVSATTAPTSGGGGGGGSDEVAPTWPSDDALRLAESASDRATLAWPAATDDVGVVRYTLNVFSDDASLPSIVVPAQSPQPTEYRHEVTGLTAGVQYYAYLEAVDAAGNIGYGGYEPFSPGDGPVAPTQVPLTATVPARGQVQLSWSAPTTLVDDLVILRAEGDGDFVDIATDVPAANVTYVDTDRSAGATYRYRVDAVAGEDRWPHTTEATVTLPALKLWSLDWGAPATYELAIGDEVTVTAVGDPGLEATATIEVREWPDATWGDGVVPVERSFDIDLAETTEPGTYRGGFVIPEGMTRLAAITGHLTDGTTTVHRDASWLPSGDVAGAVEVVVEGDYAELDAAQLSVRSDERWDGEQRLLGEDRTVRFGSLLAATDYALGLGRPYGTSYAGFGGIVVRPGLTTELSVTPRIAANLIVDTTGPDASFTVPSSLVATDVGTGETVASWAPSSGYWSGPRLWGLEAGQQVTVTATFPAGQPWQRTTTTGPITVQPGANRTSLTATALPRTTLSGRVEDPAGGPAAHTTVVVTQTFDGRPWRYSTQTDEDGRFSVDVLDGPVTVRASNWRYRERVAEVDDLATPVTIRFVGWRDYELDLTVTTKAAGDTVQVRELVGRELGEPVPVRLWVENAGRPTQRLLTDPATVSATPGDTLRICADGASVTRACETIEVGDDLSLSAEFHLEEGGAVRATIQNADGSLFTDRWKAAFDPLGGTYNQHQERWGSGSIVEFAVPAAGPHTLRVDGTGLLSTGNVAVDVPPGDIAEVDAQVRERSGLLYGEGNRVTVSPTEVTPGGTMEVRIGYDASDWLWQERVSDAVMRVPLPVGTELVAGSVQVNAAEPLSAPDVTGGILSLPLEGQPHQGVVRFRSRLVDSSDGGDGVVLQPGDEVAVMAELDFELEDEPLVDVIGQTSVWVPTVTLAAPARTGKDTVPVAGRAPGGSEVLVRTAGRVVATAVASEQGYWRAQARLPYVAPQHEHALIATAVRGVDVFTSDATLVVFDTTDPDMASVTVRQPGKTGHTFDPREGLARFPFVFRPWDPVIVEVDFTTPDRISELRVRIGEEDTHVAQRVGDLFVATVPTIGRGQIFVDYDVLPAPVREPEVLAAEGDLRAAMPEWLAGLDVGDVVESDLPDGRALDVQLTLPGTDYSGQLRVELGDPVVLPEGTPTGTHLSLDPVPAALGPGTDTFTMSGTVVTLERVEEPAQTVPAGFTSPDAFVRLVSAGEIIAPVLGAVRAVGRRFVAEVDEVGTLKQGETAYTGAAEMGNAAGSKYGNYTRLYDVITPCKKEKWDQYNATIQWRAVGVGATDITLYGLGLVGAAAAPSTFGASTALTAASIGADAFANEAFNLDSSLIEEGIRKDPDCYKQPTPGGGGSGGGTGGGGSDDPDDDDVEPDPPAGGGTAVADPGWQHDPSGNVYAGVYSNRLEGVVATLLYAEERSGPYAVWEADGFGQLNPLITDTDGHYAWDVPEGWWQVTYAHEGYELARSERMQVLPPHFDVHVGLLDTAAPEVVSVTPRPGGSVDVAFDRHMLVDSVLGRLAVRQGDVLVPGSVTAIAPELAPVDRSEFGQPFEGRMLADRFTFTPTEVVAPTTRLGVTVDPLVVSYANRTMVAAHQAHVDVPRAGQDGGQGAPGELGAAPTTGTWTVAAGGTVPPSTPTVTSAVPVVVSVTTPVAGTVSVATTRARTPDGFRQVGTAYEVTAPRASTDDPLVLTFRVAASALAGVALEDVTVLRDGAPAPACRGEGARPDPCVTVQREGDVVLVRVRTSHASRWAVVVADGSICRDGGDSGFADVPARNVHAGAIACLVSRGIAAGFGADRYGPDRPVTRAQMASFLIRSLERLGVELPSARSRFTDLGASPHRRAVEQLAALGVANGVDGASFEPQSEVTRAQMASFLVRAATLVDGDTSSVVAPDAFADDDGSTHEPAIDTAAALGLTTGTAPGRFDPHDHVRRDQMASFLVRLLGRVS